MSDYIDIEIENESRVIYTYEGFSEYGGKYILNAIVSVLIGIPVFLALGFNGHLLLAFAFIFFFIIANTMIFKYIFKTKESIILDAENLKLITAKGIEIPLANLDSIKLEKDSKLDNAKAPHKIVIKEHVNKLFAMTSDGRKLKITNICVDDEIIEKLVGDIRKATEVRVTW